MAAVQKPGEVAEFHILKSLLSDALGLTNSVVERLTLPNKPQGQVVPDQSFIDHSQLHRLRKGDSRQASFGQSLLEQYWSVSNPVWTCESSTINEHQLNPRNRVFAHKSYATAEGH